MSKDFSNILSAYKNMTRSKTGVVEEVQPKIEHPSFNETKDEIIDIINAVRSIHGKDVISEESIKEENEKISVKLTEASRKMIDMYAKKIK